MKNVLKFSSVYADNPFKKENESVMFISTVRVNCLIYAILCAICTGLIYGRVNKQNIWNGQENILGNLEMNLSTRNYQKIRITPQSDGEINLNTLTTQKWSFALIISSVNVTKSAVFCGFGHIYERNYWW